MASRLLSARTVAVVFVAILAFAALALFLTAWMGSLAPGYPMITQDPLRITDVQFGAENLTIKVSNPETRIWMDIQEVIVDDLNQTIPPRTFLVNQRIPAGEQRSIILSYEWASGFVYQVRLTYTRGNLLSSSYVAVAP